MSNEQGCKPYGPLGRRASLRRAHVMDASLQLSHLQLLDDGMYRCQLVHGIEDESVVVSLWVEGQRKHRTISVLFITTLLLLSFLLI